MHDVGFIRESIERALDLTNISGFVRSLTSPDNFFFRVAKYCLSVRTAQSAKFFIWQAMRFARRVLQILLHAEEGRIPRVLELSDAQDYNDAVAL
jgi:hypothetical protein